MFDGIAQALENEVATNIVFNALMWQVPNLKQQVRRQHGGSLPSCSPNVVQEHKVGQSLIV
jgi:hypothetical protein